MVCKGPVSSAAFRFVHRQLNVAALLSFPRLQARKRVSVAPVLCLPSFSVSIAFSRCYPPRPAVSPIRLIGNYSLRREGELHRLDVKDQVMQRPQYCWHSAYKCRRSDGRTRVDGTGKGGCGTAGHSSQNSSISPFGRN